MPTKVVEQIKEKVRVGYRSSDHVVKREAIIRLSPDNLSVIVVFDVPEETRVSVTSLDSEVAHQESQRSIGMTDSLVLADAEQDSPDSNQGFRIHISEISMIKVKDLFDNVDGNLWNLSVIMASQSKSGQVHHSFQFEKEDIRNMWDHGLRSIVFRAGPRHMLNKESSEKDENGEMTLKKIAGAALKTPSSGMLVTILVTFQASPEEAYLDIPTDNANPDDCKRLTEEFVKKYKIAFTHSTSLYRLVRAVTSRALLEQETQQVIAEMDRANAERILEDQANREKTASQRVELVVKAQERLDKLIKELPQRMGQSGPAATLVGDMLKRNAMKMKLVNEAIMPRAAS